MKFQRIQDLRIDSDLSQKKIGEILHISQRSYSHYETGSRNIPIEMLIRLADIMIPPLIIWLEEPITKNRSNDAESESVSLTRILFGIKSVRIYRTLIPGFAVEIIRNIICYKLTSMACIDFILCKFQLI